ncbi:MAG: hypothetical protein H6Q72_2732 [Firmicutes bacterium]|nr:hypothetical protein [Bacillota bacterium]
MKINIILCLLLLTLVQPVSAEIKPIIWSESIHNTTKPPVELVNVDDHIIIKSDRTLSLDLTENLPIKTIILRPDNRGTTYLEKKMFLFSIELSDSTKKVIDLPIGEHKFN